jgi:hypothetical protein
MHSRVAARAHLAHPNNFNKPFADKLSTTRTHAGRRHIVLAKLMNINSKRHIISLSVILECCEHYMLVWSQVHMEVSFVLVDFIC